MGRTKAAEQLQRRLQRLKAHVAALQRRTGRLKESGGRAGSTGRPTRYAVADRSRCTGCGLCEQLCPAGAIRVTYVANIDARRCTGCGLCVEQCPQGAIRLGGAAPAPATERSDD
jgi:ferredoxin